MSLPRVAVPDDVVELLSCLDAEGVAYLVVGAHALAAHGAPRYTGDFDVLVRPDADNAARAWRALRAFGAPLAAHGLTVEDLATPGTVYQLGLPPRRIDLLTQISGLDFDEAWDGRATLLVGDRPAGVLGVAALRKNKRAAGRPKDLADLALLDEAVGVDPES